MFKGGCDDAIFVQMFGDSVRWVFCYLVKCCFWRSEIKIFQVSIEMHNVQGRFCACQKLGELLGMRRKVEQLIWNG